MSERRKKGAPPPFTARHRPQPATDPQAITIERVERGMAILAYLMSFHDADYTPLYEKLEREREALLRQQDTVARARRLLERYSGRPPALAPPINGEEELAK